MNVAGMTYDDQTVLASFHADNELGYPLLQDVDVKHVDAYGIRNMQYKPGDGGYGIPEPGVLYIGPDGVVRHKVLRLPEPEAARRGLLGDAPVEGAA